MIVTMQPWHLMAVAMNLQEDDIVDFRMTMGEVDRQRWACERALARGLAFATLDAEGGPKACFGFLEDSPGRSTAWLVGTAGWRRHVPSMTKAFLVVVNEGGYRRIQAYARPSRCGAEKLLKWLGFSLDGPLPAMCADGSPMNLYSMTR